MKFFNGIIRQDRTEQMPLPHLCWLDVLRALAALSVVLTHYLTFHSPQAGDFGILGHSVGEQPFFGLLKLFYTQGSEVVNLFWVISGFVFASTYVKNEIVSARIFFVNRFARLYPLHFLTLMIVAVLQLVSLAMTGHFQIFANNSLCTLVLNLFFASGWGIVPLFSFSFNGPIWSVSLEIVIYAIFFLSLRLVVEYRSLAVAVIALFFGLLSVFHVPGVFWPCGLYFYTGCLIFFLWHRFFLSPYFLLFLGGLGVFLGGWIRCVGGALFGYGTWYNLILFSAIVLIAAALDLVDTRKIGGHFRIFGEMSYGIYLWHIPVTITGILILSFLGISRDVIFTKTFFFFYLALILTVAYVSYRFFEHPLRDYIRKAWNSVS